MSQATEIEIFKQDISSQISTAISENKKEIFFSLIKFGDNDSVYSMKSSILENYARPILNKSGLKMKVIEIELDTQDRGV